MTRTGRVVYRASVGIITCTDSLCVAVITRYVMHSDNPDEEDEFDPRLDADIEVRACVGLSYHCICIY